jgi:CRP-like cAMP-binding protein
MQNQANTSQVSGGNSPRQKLYNKGEFLFEEGLAGTDMYLVQEGRVGIFKNTPKGKLSIGTIGAGGTIGEQSIFGSHLHAASAMALEPVRALIVNERALQSLAQAIPPWLYAMLKVIVGRLAEVRQRVDQPAMRDHERAFVSLLLLLVPRYKRERNGALVLARDLVSGEAAMICRFDDRELAVLLNRLQRRTLVELDAAPGPSGADIALKDLEALRLYNEYLLLKSRNEKFKEAEIPAALVATLSNIAYVAQKSGQETAEGTALYKSALLEDLSDHKDPSQLERNLQDLCRHNLISMMPVDNETCIFFNKNRLSRIKKIQEWLPKFTMDLEKTA